VKTIVRDVDQFRSTWLANPVARLEFAKLVERLIELGDSDSYEDVRRWIAEARATAQHLGIR
jgi:hypothetical protein